MYFPVRKRYFLIMHDLPKNSVKDASSATTGNLSAKADDDIAIRLRDVRKEYRLYDSLSDQALDVLGLSWLRFWRKSKYKTFVALNGINLDIRKGERIGIVGRNGAGKTTLLKLITGNFAPTSGTIDVNGNVQALMQTGLGFHGEFTGMENIRSALAYSGLPAQDVEAAIDDIIDFCELGDFIHQPMKAYSLGMRARLQFAVSTAIKPDIVIIDEVLGAGDAYFAGKSVARIERLTESGATLLIVSHSMQQILQFSTKAIWIEHGDLMSVGLPLDIVNLYEENISKIERKKANRQGNGVKIPEWIKEKAELVHKKGSDWGGEGPLFLENIILIDENHKIMDRVTSRQKIGLSAVIRSTQAGTFSCSCLFVVYNERGDVTCRVVQDQVDYHFETENAQQTVICWIDDSPIGSGKYIVSAGLYKDYDVAIPSKGHRYNILSRGYEFEVYSSNRNNANIIINPNWQMINKVVE